MFNSIHKIINIYISKVGCLEIRDKDSLGDFTAPSGFKVKKENAAINRRRLSCISIVSYKWEFWS